MRRLAIVASALVVASSLASAALAAAALKGSYFANNRTGTYELTFTPRYYVENVTYHAGGFTYGEGKYSVNGHTLTLLTGEVAGRVSCNGQYKGAYTFNLTGNTLTFKLVSDKCTTRHSVFRLTFTKQQMG